MESVSGSSNKDTHAGNGLEIPSIVEQPVNASSRRSKEISITVNPSLTRSGLTPELANHLRNSTDISTNSQSAAVGEEDFEYDKNVVAVFVARFDTHRGNTIEWQYPADFNLEDVEFRAIVSGLHNVSKDTIFFTKSPYIGLSAYENAPTTGQSQERGARMRAVGVIVFPTPDSGRCGQVWRHIDFLRTEVSEQVKTDQSSNNQSYARLIEYFQKNNYDYEEPHATLTNKRPLRINRGISISSLHGPTTRSRPLSYMKSSSMSNIPYYGRERGASVSSLARVINTASAPKEVHHPAHAFLEFVRCFGPNIFVLWRASLLKKKILFCVGQGYDDGSVEEACQFVYNTCLLATVPRVLSQNFSERGQEKLTPLFCINVNDIPMVEAVEGGYIACTTDRIYQQKQNLYDIFINLTPSQTVGPISLTQKTKNILQLPDHPEFIISPSDPPFLTKRNATDIRRYRILRRLLRMYDEAQLNTNSEIPEIPTVQDDNNDETDTFVETTRKMMVGGWFWWYGRDTWGRKQEHPELDVEELFPGNRRKPRWWKQAMQFSRRQQRDSGLSEGSGLLGGMEVEEDADEVQIERTNSGSYRIKQGNRDIFNRDAPTTADIPEEASSNEEEPPRQSSADIKLEVEMELIRFFHLLSAALLSTLRSMLMTVIPEEDDGRIYLYREHMLQLGMDPTADAGFVEELSRLYFSKEVEVVRGKGLCMRCWDNTTDALLNLTGQLGCCCFEGMGV